MWSPAGMIFYNLLDRDSKSIKEQEKRDLILLRSKPKNKSINNKAVKDKISLKK
jgi:hypothetical protein